MMIQKEMVTKGKQPEKKTEEDRQLQKKKTERKGQKQPII